MVTDVLIALRRSKSVDAVVVVTGESSATALAFGHGADAIPDPDDAGHAEAAARGVDWAVTQGADRVLLVPGDTPALDPKELDALLVPHPFHPLEPEVVIVPDRHGTRHERARPDAAQVIAPSFGPGSRERHAAPGRGRRRRGAPGGGPDARPRRRRRPTTSPSCRPRSRARTGGASHTRGMLVRLGRR